MSYRTGREPSNETSGGFRSAESEGGVAVDRDLTSGKKLNLSTARGTYILDLPEFKASKYPDVLDCQKLDAQISGLRNDRDLVYRNEMKGKKKEVKDLLLKKELQFNEQNCSKKLEDEVVYGSVDMLQEGMASSEDDIIAESNKKRLVLLLGGGIVLLIGVAIFVK